MDIYLISFAISTLWIGPFWFAMLFQPNAEKTKLIMSKPIFFLGPIAIWFFVMFTNPNGLINFFNSGSHQDGFFAGLAKGMSTKAGITAMWAHMVAGDIFATRWIWKNCLKDNCHIWIIRFSVFFGVMLMPVGIFIYYIFSKTKSKS